MLRFGRFVHAVMRLDDEDVLLCRLGRGADLREAPPEAEVDCPECCARLRGQTRRR
jgi:hypothetical protein